MMNLTPLLIEPVSSVPRFCLSAPSGAGGAGWFLSNEPLYGIDTLLSGNTEQ